MPYTSEEKHILKEKYQGEVCDAFLEDCARLIRGEPLAYIIGTQPFLGATIHLDSKPLIPRPETEHWVLDAIALLKRRTGKTIRILDLFSGSGAVGVAILGALPNAHVTFGDIREDHLKTAQKNVRENGIALSRTDYIATDVLKNIAGTFDAILANPPYIPEGRPLPDSVLRYEPHDALLGGHDGLRFINDTLVNAKKHLGRDGVLYLEHDALHQKTLRRMAQYLPYEISWRNDQYDRPRYLIARPV